MTFDGIVFTVRFCESAILRALDVRDSGELRLAKIIRLMDIAAAERQTVDALTFTERLRHIGTFLESLA